MSSTHAALSRRVVLQSGLAGGLVLAFQWPLRAAPVNEPEQPPDHPDGQFAPNAFIRIDKSGKTTLVMPQAEMGQGVYTAIAMILAEELDADFAQVVIEHAPPATSFTAIRFSAFRSPAIPTRSARSGTSCARQAPPRAPC